MRTVHATRYVTPLREGGSLPAVVETDDGSLVVLKFVGAGQGPRALVSEWIAGSIARACGLDVPELVRVMLDPVFGRNEPDPEVRDLLRASAGANLGLAYLPGAIGYDPIAPPQVDAETASAIVWLDAFALNVDRTPRNPNLLVQGGRLWLIDHGAALYFHHAWATAGANVANAFAVVRDHVLLPRATELDAVDARMVAGVQQALADRVIDAIPDAWLPPDAAAGDAALQRKAYDDWLTRRLERRDAFVREAERVRCALV